MAEQVLTEERVKQLSEIILSDKDRAKKILELGADEAVREINALGHHVTVEEIKAYGEKLINATQLGDDALEHVAGGNRHFNFQEFSRWFNQISLDLGL